MGEHRILLVEDDVPIRKMIGKYLQAQGYHVGLASDGVDALTLVGSSAAREIQALAEFLAGAKVAA
jgi:DNA-binding response OmpR family regulator